MNVLTEIPAWNCHSPHWSEPFSHCVTYSRRHCVRHSSRGNHEYRSPNKHHVNRYMCQHTLSDKKPPTRNMIGPNSREIIQVQCSSARNEIKQIKHPINYQPNGYSSTISPARTPTSQHGPMTISAIHTITKETGGGTYQHRARAA